LKGKKMSSVLVTGAAGGIGKSVCEVFHEAGYTVLGVDRRRVSEPPYQMIQFDISKLVEPDPECEAFINQIEEVTEGNLEALINNAAVQIVKPIEDVSSRDWRDTLDTNLLAPFCLIQRFLPYLRQAKGSVINVASIHAMATKAQFSVYATSKGALVSLTRALAIELAPDVRVNAIVPAATDTPMLRAGFGDNLKGLQELGSYHPLGRIAYPEEVARVALFLAGGQSSFMTGSAINVDGGLFT
jgi:NAD(P)-dependent dehydrogenase (short-subunit alcohol dehydrogenase family)